ncbi:unnamed protein product [Coffea canephora]|uniref:DH200=94 genomic scaffold, scaffold_572 n=1 Tax=Coffea canephora TaxID=49390 RepID=A0A068VG87_COFCA|nr:unnamed protein product [Coffea canephora]
MPSGTNKVLNLFIKLYSNISLCNSVKVVAGRHQATWIQGHLFHHLQLKFRPDFPKPELGCCRKTSDQTTIKGHLFHQLQLKFHLDFPIPQLCKLKFVYC